MLLGTEALRRRQLTIGATLEEMEAILQPMVEDANEATGSMGDDTPVAVLSEQYRGLHNYFRQNFSQVTNPPIDSLRETRVMSLKTRLGNLGNVLEEGEHQFDILQLNSPILSTGEFIAMRETLGAVVVEIDATFALRRWRGRSPARGFDRSGSSPPSTAVGPRADAVHGDGERSHAPPAPARPAKCRAPRRRSSSSAPT